MLKMTIDQIRVMNDMIQAARLLRDDAATRGIQPGFLETLETFSRTMAVDDGVLKQWKISREEHNRCLAEAFQKLKQEN
jgi:hypothetical protein